MPAPESTARDRSHGVPLCVDLDGTLLRGNSLYECAWEFLRREPWLFWQLPIWLLRGQAVLWKELTARVELSGAHYAFDPEVRDFLDQQRTERDLILVTGAHQTVAESVAGHFGYFSAVYGTKSEHLTGQNKAAFLSGQFGVRGFDYLGDSAADLPVWEVCRTVYLARPDSRLVSRLTASGTPPAIVGAASPPSLRSAVRLLRPQQWAKNILIFVPIVLGHAFGDLQLWWKTLLAFGSFCGASSAMYILNDLLDIPADRQHHRKHKRPIASGAISIPMALLLFGGSLGFSLLLSIPVGLPFAGITAMYIVLVCLYSVHFKTRLTIDIVLLSAFYTLRIFAGSAATGIPISFWTLLSSLFFFFSLACLKRCSELSNLSLKGKQQAVRRAYRIEDLPQLLAIGIACGVLTVVIIGLYINSPEVRRVYRKPDVLWLVCPLLLAWISRIWIISGRGHLHEDPVAFALKDRWSLVSGVVGAGILMAAI